MFDYVRLLNAFEIQSFDWCSISFLFNFVRLDTSGLLKPLILLYEYLKTSLIPKFQSYTTFASNVRIRQLEVLYCEEDG